MNEKEMNAQQEMIDLVKAHFDHEQIRKLAALSGVEESSYFANVPMETVARNFVERVFKMGIEKKAGELLQEFIAHPEKKGESLTEKMQSVVKEVLESKLGDLPAGEQAKKVIQNAEKIVNIENISGGTFNF